MREWIAVFGFAMLCLLAVMMLIPSLLLWRDELREEREKKEKGSCR